MKKCCRCHEDKPFSDFYRCVSRPDGLYGYCKACAAVRRKQYHTNNKDRCLAKAKEWKENNKEKVKVAAADWGRKRYASDKEGCAARVREWRLRNPGKSSEYMREYYRQHLSAFAESSARRRASRILRTPKWADFGAIEKVYAEAREQGLSVDHYYPLRGKTVSGLHVANNLRLIPLSENDSKGNKHPEEFYGKSATEEHRGVSYAGRP